ncbi:hypothetical protein HXZ94_12070 [Empedobacter falsenii]|uniref:hypothetical protein n=1 Tax=Empedobacter falsenii TaxID=343874 RepID=UPI0025759081|nr:hypothetical protein [Empedobacter falsenii]MDM1299226.1 hypothetical protein [Empedobacter falsenii]MDM1319112.1 hypothetical protein [Empedobacter falsenii]
MKEIKPKYYLNKNLKPKIEDGVEKYPVYFRFNLNGSNHRIKSQLIDYLASEEELDNYQYQMIDEIKSLNYLYNRFRENYSFSNFENDMNKIFYPQILGEPVDDDDKYSYFKKSKNNTVLTSDGDVYNKNIFRNDSLDKIEENYRNELINFISDKTTLTKDFLRTFLIKEFKNTTLELPTFFIDDIQLEKKIKNYNMYVEFANKNDLTVKKWYTEKYNEKFKKEYGELAYQEVEKMFDELVDNQLNVKK